MNGFTYEGISLISTRTAPESLNEGFPFSLLEPQQKSAHSLIYRFIKCKNWDILM